MTMRTFPDRIRHAVLFELIGLAIITPATAWLYDKPVLQMGVVGVGAATLATVWTFVFNLGFDHALQHVLGHTRKTIGLRLMHVVLFVLGLLVMILPPVAWYLDMTLFETFMLDLSIVLFYMVYNFGFNIAYDRLFPISSLVKPQLAG